MAISHLAAAMFGGRAVASGGRRTVHHPRVVSCMSDEQPPASQSNLLTAPSAKELAMQPITLPAAGSNLPPLTTEDWGLLTRLERQLSSRKTPLSTVASAVATIKQKGLARLRQISFQEYCDQQLTLKKSRVHQLLEFAELLEVTGSGNLPPADNERQLRPLKKLPREEWAGAWGEAVRTAPAGKLTGRHVQAVVDSRLAQMRAAQLPAPAPAPEQPPVVQAVTPVATPLVEVPATFVPPAPTAPLPTPADPELVPTVLAPTVAMPGWKEAWEKVARSPVRPPASLRSGVFGWQPGD